MGSPASIVSTKTIVSTKGDKTGFQAMRGCLPPILLKAADPSRLMASEMLSSFCILSLHWTCFPTMLISVPYYLY